MALTAYGRTDDGAAVGVSNGFEHACRDAYICMGLGMRCPRYRLSGFRHGGVIQWWA
jgi:hypothetical protein